MTDPATAPKRVVVLASGAGSTLQALLDAAADPSYGVVVAAVGTDRPTAGAVDRARAAGVTTFVAPVGADRAAWDADLADQVASFEPDLVVSAGFMRLAGPEFLARFAGRYVNSHPALLPSFPGMHGARDAVAYGVKVSGCTVHFVDEHLDAGPIIVQRTVEVREDDDASTLAARILEQEHGAYVEALGKLAAGYRVEGRRVVFDVGR